MRILFLSHYFPPEVNAPAVRTFEHCREWVRAGHEVHVVTCVPNHPQGKVYEGYKNRFVTRHEERDGIHVHRVWTYVAPNKGFLRRTAGYVSYLLSSPLTCLRIPRPDVIVATSPQFFCACAGYLVSKLLRCPWVFEVRDLWPASIVAVGAIRSKVIIRFLETIELGLYANADSIVALTNAFKNDLVARGIAGPKIHVIPNGIDLDSWEGADPGSARMELGLNSEFVVSYVGTHGMAHNLETLLEAADILRDEPEVHFVTVGDGAEFEKVSHIRDEKKLHNVTMVGQVPRAQAKMYLQASDVSVVLLRKAELFKSVIPSKILEAMAAQKPVILGVEGEAQRIVEQAGAGICIQPQNAHQLADAILELKRDAALRKRLGINGLLAVEQQFDREVLAGRMLDVIKNVDRVLEKEVGVAASLEEWARDHYGQGNESSARRGCAAQFHEGRPGT